MKNRILTIENKIKNEVKITKEIMSEVFILKNIHRTLKLSAIGLLIFLLPQKALAVSVNVAPDCRNLQANQTQQFQATVSGATDTSVVWMVNGVRYGAPEIGTITDQGLYTAPANMDAAVDVTITAASVENKIEIARVKICNQAFMRPGNAYYVSTSGSNSNVGSIQSPWRNIQYAVGHVQPGDTIIVRGGVYNETVTITTSGSATGGFITLSEYGGESAIVDGTGLAQPTFGMQGLITLDNVSYVRVKDLEVRNYKSSSPFIVLGVLVKGAGERLEIRNNYIHAIEANNPPASGSANAQGIGVIGQSATSLRNVIVAGNELFDLKTGTSESLTIGGNVENWQVTNNSIHNNNFIGIDASGYYTDMTEISRARKGWIASNAVFNLSAASNPALTFAASAIGIYVDGGKDITIERNTVDANDVGIGLLSERAGKNAANVTVRNNLVRFNQDAGIFIGGYNSTQSGGVADCAIVNNTLYNNNSRNNSGINSGELQINYNYNNIIFQNNIMYAGQKGYNITKFTPQNAGSINIGYNIYFTSSGASYTRWYWADRTYVNDGTSTNDFAAFKLVSGDAGNTSLAVDPSFVSINPQNLRLNANSPGIDSGHFNASLGVAAVGVVDYAGAARVIGSTIDRGAYERQ